MWTPEPSGPGLQLRLVRILTRGLARCIDPGDCKIWAAAPASAGTSCVRLDNLCNLFVLAFHSS